MSIEKRSPAFFLFDALVACLKIEDTASQFDDVEMLKHDYRAWDSMMFEFTIIGEAVKYLVEDGVFPNTYRSVVNFRNIVVHHYFGLESEEVWDVVVNHLPVLKRSLIEQIERLDNDERDEVIEELMVENAHIPIVVKMLETLKGEPQ
jgi:uncharacterized protein with HEPN domain